VLIYLKTFDDDKLIPAFGFGDAKTGDHGVFSFYPDRVAYGFQVCCWKSGGEKKKENKEKKKKIENRKKEDKQ
jgi:hypothetical protein